PAAATPSAIDNCDGNPSIALVETSTQTVSGLGHYNYTITRIWTATDVTANTSSGTQVITVSDTTAPVADASSLASATGQCTATIDSAPTATDNCNGTIVGTTTNPLTRSSQGTSTVTWTFTDVVGNSSTQTQDIVVIDTTAPVANITSLPTVTGECSASVTAPTATDNCAGVISATTANPTTYTAQGTYTVTWTYNDGNGNTSSQNQTVIVKDITVPTIVCPSNIVLSACQSTATWATPTGSDNCSGFSVMRTGPASGSTFANGTTTTITYTVTDVGGNTASCSFTVTRQAALALAVTNSNPQLYYGYTLDQSTTIKGTPSGGVGPYKVVITMNRVLACNVLNSAGDETWTASAGGSSTGNTCPGSGPGTTPVSTHLTVPVGGFYSVTSILLANATFTVTVTDANGCVVSGTTNVYSEDARCFAGNSAIVKVKICHKTGNSKDPCHELCVSESAVAAHIAHGDYIGACLANCTDPVVHTKHIEVEEAAKVFKVIGYPNPSKNQFTVEVLSDSNDKVEVAVYDMLARLIRRFESDSKSSPIRFGEDLPSGEYLTVVKQGENIKVLNLIKQ
uniref:HYR-like domain-containing protein n=1 Tax=Flavobacterium sp. TaxID=239 RepID=UPI00286D466C